jgi:hypothetical protein
MSDDDTIERVNAELLTLANAEAECCEPECETKAPSGPNSADDPEGLIRGTLGSRPSSPAL